jgi:hypothetical protein
MQSARRGKNTSAVEVTNISPHGFWLVIGEQERFISFQAFPWFREATIAALTHVELPSAHHLYWPELDIDLAVESLDHPEKYPLISRARANTRLKATAAAVKERRSAYTARRGRRRRSK